MKKNMTDSVTGGLLKRGALRTTLLDLPAEMVRSICEYSDLLSLAHLSASCRKMRDQVHDIFTSRIEAQAKKYPEVKQSLDRLGWMKKHDLWDCKCFKMMAGPFFAWTELEEQRSFSFSSEDSSTMEWSRTSTTVVGRTFFATRSREVSYVEMAPDQDLVQTLASFKNEAFSVVLSSYDNVLAIGLGHYSNLRHFASSVCFFNASTLARVCEVNLCDETENVVQSVALTRDTMVVNLDCYDIQMECELKIQIWKLNTEDPEEDGISLLHTMTTQNSLLTQHRNFRLISSGPFLSINERFLVIFDNETDNEADNEADNVVQVFGRIGDTPLVHQLEFENKTVKTMKMQGGSGDHLALALLSVNADNVSELTVKVYSVSQGNLIVQKEVGQFPRRSAPFLMKWFGDHLTVGSQQDNTVSFFSWQPGLESFLTSPCGVPVLRRSPRGNRGDTALSPRGNGEDTTLWTANCLHVDFQGITTAAVRNLQDGYEDGSTKVLFKTWKSTA